jgi:hypothetical protein
MNAIICNHYFAYGSNMDPRQMQERCPGAKPVGKARLKGWEFAISERGVATIERSEGHVVHGVLWKIAISHEVTLDRKEGVARGFYGKFQLPCYSARGQCRPALVYIDPLKDYGRPAKNYLDKILFGAYYFKLNPAYIDQLMLWA